MLTPADLKGRKLVNPMHVDFARGRNARSAWIYRVEGLLRLTVMDESDARGGKRRVFIVDNQAVPDLEAACAVLNGENTVEQVVAEAAAAKIRKISIGQQIEEIDYELAQRRQVYPRIASSGGRKASELEFHVQRLEAVRATLTWLQEHEALIKQRLSY